MGSVCGYLDRRNEKGNGGRELGRLITPLLFFSTGSGGNNHALDHYSDTKYPLAVKLGTITPGGADVYSYDEDSMVLDPKLSDHLSHFGINMMAMSKVSESCSAQVLELSF